MDVSSIFNACYINTGYGVSSQGMQKMHRLVDHSNLPPETVFDCVLSIPGTLYEIKEESIYCHQSGRKWYI